AVRGEGDGVDGARQDLAADLAGRTPRGVNVDVEVAGVEIGDVGGRHAAPRCAHRTGRIAEVEDDRAVHPGCAAVDVHHRGVDHVVDAGDAELRPAELRHAAARVGAPGRRNFLIAAEMKDERLRGRGQRYREEQARERKETVHW